MFSRCISRVQLISEEARLLAEQEERDRKDREKVEAEETRRLENEVI